MTKSYEIDSIEVVQAKRGVETRFGRVPNSPKDFMELSLAIEYAIGTPINEDTLSRLWGYKPSYKRVRVSTLRTLSKYASGDVESGLTHTKVVHADDINVGGKLSIAWLPDRVCTIEYLGEWRWKVVEATNSKLHVGDTFSCRTLAVGEQLFIDNLEQDGKQYDGYVIGKKNGLTSVTILNSVTSMGDGCFNRK